MRYDHSPGRREEHVNPHKVAGTVPGRTWQARAHTMDEHARVMRPELSGKHIHRTALRVAPEDLEDRQLTDKECQIAEQYVERMGFQDCPWEATRHADDHIHITVSRVQWDGELARVDHDFARAQIAVRRLEREHGLIDASQRYDRDRPQVSHGEKESAAKREVVPEREQLRNAVHAAEHASWRTREHFEEVLERLGVHAAANVATTGRVSGYKYGIEGHTDTKDQQVWFKGSDLGKEFSWARTAARIEAAPPGPNAVQLQAARLAELSSPTPARGASRSRPAATARVIRGERDRTRDEGIER
jgi:phosphoglycolate phosphatase-like HAD superfamily hydrolase